VDSLKENKMKKLVLAYSGGLDTSYCLKTLSQDGYEVHAVSVNTGGFSVEEIKAQEEKAYAMGATTYKSIDALETFYAKIVKYLIFGNVLKNNTYPLSLFKPSRSLNTPKALMENILPMVVREQETTKCVLI